MTLPGFHAPRNIVIHVAAAGDHLWHYFDQSDKETPLCDRALTGNLIGFWLKESQSERNKDKPGIERLKAYLKVQVFAEETAFLYTLAAGLDTTFFRTLLISLADIPIFNRRQLMTLEVSEGTIDKSVVCQLRAANSGRPYRGKVYGKKWEGLDYPRLVWDTLNSFKAPSESYDLLGYQEPTKEPSIPEPTKEPPIPAKKEWLYPQHNDLIRRARLAANLEQSWCAEYFDIQYEGTMPGDLTLAAIEQVLIEWAGLCEYGQSLGQDEAERQLKSAIANAKTDGQTDLAGVFIDWLAGWTADAPDVPSL